MDPEYEFALEFYKSRGINVIALGHHEKRPPEMHHGGRMDWKTYQSRLSTQAERTYWFSGVPDKVFNLGVVTGDVSQLIVIDCDDQASYDELIEAMPWMADTLTARTAHGYHTYIRPTEPGTPTYTFRVNDTLNHVKAEGGYVVAPPSIHPDGAAYRWACSTDAPILEVQPNVVRHALEMQGWLEGTDPDRDQEPGEAVSDWVALLMEEFCLEGGRNDRLIKLAGWFRNVVLRKDVTITILRHWNEMRCIPPLPDAEVLRTINNIYRTTPAPAWAQAMREPGE